MPVTVIALGGSLIAPNGVDVGFVGSFANTVTNFLDEREDRRLVIITGGGSLARSYQQAFRQLQPAATTAAQDWIGISATRVNGELVRQLFGDRAPDPVVLDPSVITGFSGRVLVAAGWKPGFSTDYDAVLLAASLGARRLVSLSNLPMIYSADPKVDASARQLPRLTWSELSSMVGTEWRPGAHTPFDPEATRLATEQKLVLIAAGASCENLARILRDEPFVGSTVGPD